MQEKYIAPQPLAENTYGGAISFQPLDISCFPISQHYANLRLSLSARRWSCIGNHRICAAWKRVKRGTASP